MGQVKQNFIVSQLDSWQDLQRFASSVIDNIVDVVNGNIQFGTNITASGPTVITFTSANDIHGITHNLSAVPTGVIEVYRSAAITTYAPQASIYAWTDSKIFLQSSGAGSVTVYVI